MICIYVAYSMDFQYMIAMNGENWPLQTHIEVKVDEIQVQNHNILNSIIGSN